MRHRILFYSHDTFGLGHFRRSFTIASYLARHIKNLSILMLTGLDSAAAFPSVPGVDFVKLPGIWKAGRDDYRSRHLRSSFARVLRIREEMIRSVTRAYDPAIFVADNVPTGADGELLPTLRHLKRKGSRVKICLTLRDVLDQPGEIVRLWGKQGAYKSLQEHYDEVWVVGCKSVFDPVELYRIPHRIADKFRFCGYVVRAPEKNEPRDIIREFRLDDRPLLVASCGGGGDGFPLLSAFVDAAVPITKQGARAAVFLGPDLPHEQRRQLKERLLPMSGDFLTFDFRPDLAAFFSIASASVSMAGYNTISELLSLMTPSVVVPRVVPREEQLLRAKAFAKQGLLRILHPNRLTPERLREHLQALLDGAEFPMGAANMRGLNFFGLRRIERRVRKHLGLGGSPDV